MFKSLKTNARLIAKEKWYDWRLQLTIGVQQQIQAMNASLKEVSGAISRQMQYLRIANDSLL